MFVVSERLYRTTDGRIVGHDHPEAAFLAFPTGVELSDDNARRFGVAEFYEEKRRAQAPRDKMRARPADKSIEKETP